MRHQVLAASPSDFSWLQARSGCVLTSDFRAIKAVDASGRIRGMVGYESWTPNAVQCHMAVEAPVAWRALLHPAFSYPLEQQGRGLLLATVPANNPRSVQMVESLGFHEGHRVRDGWARGVDMVVFEMRKEECRWLRPLERKAA